MRYLKFVNEKKINIYSHNCTSDEQSIKFLSSRAVIYLIFICNAFPKPHGCGFEERCNEYFWQKEKQMEVLWEVSAQWKWVKILRRRSAVLMPALKIDEQIPSIFPVVLLLLRSAVSAWIFSFMNSAAILPEPVTLLFELLYCKIMNVPVTQLSF